MLQQFSPLLARRLLSFSCIVPWDQNFVHFSCGIYNNSFFIDEISCCCCCLYMLMMSTCCCSILTKIHYFKRLGRPHITFWCRRRTVYLYVRCCLLPRRRCVVPVNRPNPPRHVSIRVVMSLKTCCSFR